MQRGVCVVVSNSNAARWDLVIVAFVTINALKKKGKQRSQISQREKLSSY